MSKNKILILNGPNLNMLGTREVAMYGNSSLEEIIQFTEEKTKDLDIEIDWVQSNHEGEIIEKIHAIPGNYKALIINPGAFSHTSVAILDAMRMLSIPIVEVHLSNTQRREDYRQVKLTAKASTIIMEGLGKKAYLVAIWSLFKD